MADQHTYTIELKEEGMGKVGSLSLSLVTHNSYSEVLRQLSLLIEALDERAAQRALTNPHEMFDKFALFVEADEQPQMRTQQTPQRKKQRRQTGYWTNSDNYYGEDE